MNWNTTVFGNGRILRWRVYDTKKNLLQIHMTDSEWSAAVEILEELGIEEDYVTAEQFGIIMRFYSELNSIEFLLGS